MGTAIRVGLVVLLALAACESSTEPEQPKLKTGAIPELAIELPLNFPPDPRQATVVTEWSVILAGKFWFRNVSENPIDLELWVTDPRTSATNRVGMFRLAAYTTNAMLLDAAFRTSEYRDRSWTLRYRQGYQVETIIVGFAD